MELHQLQRDESFDEVSSSIQGFACKVSQQILMILDKNWKSFFEAVKAYKTDASKFTGRPKLPLYKDKVKGRNILVYLGG
jgi:hypothetical protein